MSVSFQRPLLILGVERSGSTWLANILDAHPETQLFMEPFAPRMELFPDFPDRLIYREDLNSHLLTHLQEGLDELDRYKYPLLHRRAGSRLRRELVYRFLYPLSDVTTRGVRKLGFEMPLRHLRFKNLNKNRIENPFLNRFPEVASPSHTVVKELRLNFKIGLIRALWPEAKVLVILRNPLSQIASILRLIEQGKLHDLRSALYTFIEHAQEWTRAEKYRTALDGLDEDQLLHQATAYWFVNYGTMLEDLERFDVSYRVVRHETLSQAPDRERREILDFAGLRDESQTKEYVLQSSRGTNHRTSVMDTERDSESYYLKTLREVSPELRASFFEAADKFWSHAPRPTQEYESWLQEHLPAGE